MLELLIDNFVAMLGGRVFQQTVATYGYKLFKHLLPDLLLCSYGTDFIQGPPPRGCTGGRIGTRFLRPRGTSPLKGANPGVLKWDREFLRLEGASVG